MKIRTILWVAVAPSAANEIKGYANHKRKNHWGRTHSGPASSSSPQSVLMALMTVICAFRKFKRPFVLLFAQNPNRIKTRSNVTQRSPDPHFLIRPRILKQGPFCQNEAFS
ncbi:hypothetical protein BX666DRAFT_1951375 [Dichotomocladium elegans]|nr:hypothetical protein BX666DRAFT_1951375 [Dichotomocladium elegans]